MKDKIMEYFYLTIFFGMLMVVFGYAIPVNFKLNSD